MQLIYGIPEDIDKWMGLVKQVRYNFPGLEMDEKINEHRTTVLKFMNKRQAVCMKEKNEIVGVLLFSIRHNMICFSFDGQADYGKTSSKARRSTTNDA